MTRLNQPTRPSAKTQLLQAEIGQIFHWAAARAAAAHDDPAATLEWAEYASKLAWRADPGFFFDAGLESTLSAIPVAQRARKWSAREVSLLPRRGAGKCVIHVLTAAYASGGHTRVVARWIENCTLWRPQERHVVVGTSQGMEPVPDWLRTAARQGGGALIVLDPRYSIMQRAMALRQLADAWADDVVLHIHPDDSASVSALAQPRRWKAYFLNHADHVFSLGTHLCDVMLDLRWSGASASLTERSSLPVNQMLPIPMEALKMGDRGKRRAESRRALGLHDDVIVAITVGPEPKYKPSMGWDFCAAAAAILKSAPRLHLFAIGIPNQGKWHKLHRDTNGRFHAMGLIQNPKVLRDWYSAANLYFEGFPFTSVTAMLEAGLHGLPMQRFTNRVAPLLSGDDVSYEDLCPAAATQEEYISHAIALASQSPGTWEGLGHAITRSIENDHCGESWSKNWLAAIESPASDAIADDRLSQHAPADRGLQHAAILEWQLENTGIAPSLNVLKSSSHLSLKRKFAIIRKLLAQPAPLIERSSRRHLTTLARPVILAFTPKAVAGFLKSRQSRASSEVRFPDNKL